VSGLFISYRRQDAAAYAGRLRSDLAARYGDQHVFFDLANLEPGSDWTSSLHQAVADCDSMLVVMGPQWLSARDPSGRRRIDSADDFIRSEVAAALRLDKRVVPVLVGGATMPRAEELPEDVRGLAMRNALQLDDQRWHDDLEYLYFALDPLMGKAPRAAAGRTAPMRPAPASSRSMPSFMSRLAQAFDVLVGRGAAAEASAPPQPVPTPAAPAPVPPPATAPARRHDVFVSYASEDESFADDVVRALEADGRACWIAHRDIPPGVPSWAEPIVTAIASSRLMLVLLTARSIPSLEILREVTLAADEKIPLLPVSLDATALTPGLRYFFVAGQRLDLARFAPDEQVRNIQPAVARSLP
jgi:TIR domain